jgi:TonB-dependent receptor
MSFNYGMNFNAEEFTFNRKWGPDEHKNFKWKPNLQLEYSEAFFNQRLGINVGASRANSYTEQYSFAYDYNLSTTAADRRPMVIRQIDIKDGPKFIKKDNFTLTADWKVTRNLVLSLTSIYTYAEGEFWNRNMTFVAANDNTNVNNGRQTVLGNGVTEIGTRRTTSNTVPAVNIGGGTSIKLTYTRTIAPKFEYKTNNGWLFDGAFSFSKSVNNYEALERGASENEALSMPGDFIATRPRAESWEWTIRQTSGADWFNPANWTGGTRVENSGREWATEIWNGQLNARYVLPFWRALSPVLKIGGRWNEESRDNNNEDAMRIWRYIGPGGDVMTGRNATTGVPTITTSGNWSRLGFVAPHEFDTGTTNGLTVYNSAGLQGMPPRADRNRIAGLFRERPDLFVNTATPDNYYNSFITNKRDLRQTVTAGYAQADVRLSPKLTVRAGYRLERTDNAIVEWDPRLRDDVVAHGFPVNANGRATTVPGIQYQFQSQPRVTREASYHNWFPSVNGKYNIRRDLDLQFGYSKAINRPPIDNLAGLWSIVEDAAGVTQRVDAPNPNLKPEHIKKYDARIAYYFNGRGSGSRSPGSVSVAVSQFDIMNLRESHDYKAEEFGVDDPEFADYIFRSTRNSDRSRRARNLEFSYTQTLGFLPSEYLRGTSVNVAYTRSYQNARRNGLAPHRISSRLGYAYRRFNGSLGMIWIDDRPDGNYGQFRPEQTQFDLSLNWKLTNRLRLYVQGRNITNQVVKWMISPPGVAEGESPQLRQVQKYGANWVFGVRGDF